jgi:predicted ribosome quality control (RQC) complex YloA/Tae2 family protein
MYVDAITLAAVADEWRKLLIGARIDTIIQPTEHAIALQCYAPNPAPNPQSDEGSTTAGRNRWLYLSAHPQLARVHITALKPPRIASEPPAFVMLLRKHLEGARIEAINQPRWERVIEIVAGYRKSPESEERIRFRLIIEVMNRVGNIIFCDEQGMILGCLKRVGSDINRYRIVAPGVPYTPPPPQQRTLTGQSLPRLEPTTVTAAQLSICAADEEGLAALQGNESKRKRAPEPPKLWQLILKHLLGCSPLLAREAVFRATENAELLVSDATQDTWEELAWNVRDLTSLYNTKQWQPQLIERALNPAEREDLAAAGDGDNGAYVPLAFAPYVLEQYAIRDDMHVRQSPSINVLLDDFYARAEWHDAVDALRAPLRRILQTQLDRCKRKAELLDKEMQAEAEANTYRLYGELLLAHQNEVEQGPQSVVLENYFELDANGVATQVKVPLDPRFDAVTNANRYFNKYHKLRRALELVPEQTEQNNAEIATITQLLTDLKLAENAKEIELVKLEIQAQGYIRGKAALDKKASKAAKKGKSSKQGKNKPGAPGGGVPLHVQCDGFTVLVGKNSRQNEEVTFRQAASNDIWLHARGVAGAHVIIKAAGREVPRHTIDQAATLAAYYSEARGTTSTPVDYTLQRHVRHMKGGGPGLVTYDREHTIYVAPDKALSLLS